MGFDMTSNLKLLWNFPIGILRLVTVIIGCTTIGVLTKGHESNRGKEIAALTIVTLCCFCSLLVTGAIVGGINVKKLKKYDYILAIACCLLLGVAGTLMFISVFKERPTCIFGKQVNPCQRSYGLSVAGGTLSFANGVMYITLAYYLIVQKA